MKQLAMAFLLTLSLLTSVASADVLDVPGDFDRIEDAVDAASPGDVIEVASGVYTRRTEIREVTNLTIQGVDTGSGPPIIRPEILAKTPTRGDHLLVYQTAEGHGRLAETLGRAGIECRVYGMRRDLTADVVEGNLRYRPFSETTFIDDLASARGVIAGGGFTLMGEAVYFRKPMLAIPLRKQFEQVLNARYLERLDFGTAADSLDEAALERFLAREPRHAEALASYEQDGNREALETVDRVLTELRPRVA